MTKDHAIIQATYTDMKFVRTRKVIQLVFECPIEQAQHVMDAFGAPDESWYALARLNGPGQASPAPLSPSATSEGQDRKRHFSDMQPSQQSALKCQDVNFQKFLHTKHGRIWGSVYDPEDRALTADSTVKTLLDIASKRELDESEHKAKLWDSLLAEYEMWQRKVA